MHEQKYQDEKQWEAEHHEQQQRQRRRDAMWNWYQVSELVIQFFDIYDVIVVHTEESDNTLQDDEYEGSYEDT